MPIKKEKKPRPPKTAPPTVNNYLKNKPTIAKSINIYPVKKPRRDVEEVKAVVNGKVADENLIHKPAPVDPIPFFPVIEKGKSNGPAKKSTKRSPKASKE